MTGRAARSGLAGGEARELVGRLEHRRRHVHVADLHVLRGTPLAHGSAHRRRVPIGEVAIGRVAERGRIVERDQRIDTDGIERPGRCGQLLPAAGLKAVVDLPLGPARVGDDVDPFRRSLARRYRKGHTLQRGRIAAHFVKAKRSGAERARAGKILDVGEIGAGGGLSRHLDLERAAAHRRHFARFLVSDGLHANARLHVVDPAIADLHRRCRRRLGIRCRCRGTRQRKCEQQDRVARACGRLHVCPSESPSALGRASGQGLWYDFRILGSNGKFRCNYLKAVQ